LRLEDFTEADYGAHKSADRSGHAADTREHH